MTNIPTSGNTEIAVIGINAVNLAVVSSISQSGVTWSKQVCEAQWKYAQDIEIWLGTVGSSASGSVSICLNGTADYGAIADICEYSGLVSSPLDKTATNKGGVGSQTNTGTTSMTSNDNELWVGGIGTETNNGGQSDPSNGFTLLDGAKYMLSSNAYLEKIVSSKGQASSGTKTAGISWYGCIATFKSYSVTISPTTIHFLRVGETQTFTCTASGGTPPYTYSWYLNSTCQTETSNQFQFTPEASAEGTINYLKCDVADSKGQSQSSNVVDIMVPLATGQIAQVEITGKELLRATMFHAARNEFVILGHLEDLTYKQSGGFFTTHPLETVFQIEMPYWCTEGIPAHQPVQQDYGSSQSPISFNYYFVSFTMQGPAYRVKYESWYDATSQKFICRWTLKWGYVLIEKIITGWPWIDYVEFSIGINVPEGYKPSANIGAATVWYTHSLFPVPHFGNWFREDAEELWTPILDPPGSEPITSPTPIGSIPDPGRLSDPEPILELIEWRFGDYTLQLLWAMYWVPNEGYTYTETIAFAIVRVYFNNVNAHHMAFHINSPVIR